MQFLPFLILATLAAVLLFSPSWPWMRSPGVAPYAPFFGGFWVFVLACEILWMIFGAGSGCAHAGAG